MRQLYAFSLGLGFGICLYLVVFQGFAAPALSTGADALLRLGAGVCIQLLAIRLRGYYLLRFSPLALTSLLAVWGFFLFLTSPSWQGATLGMYLADYLTPVLGCMSALLLYFKRHG